ncbi:MAG TPA: hypothetical protein DCQ04_15335 [Actinobacteria bacterium]|nr:hypothetical protein [Actinomycetota bacterium]
MSEAAGSPTGVAFTDGARGIRPWLGGVALGTAGFAAATEYVASEHFRILEPVVTLTPVILASILATLAIGLHVVFFTTVPHRIAQLRDPTVWGLLAAAPGTFVVAGIAVATRVGPEQAATVAVTVGLAAVLCAAVIAAAMIAAIFTSPRTSVPKITGACFIPGTVLMLAPILASRESAKMLDVHQSLLVELPVGCFFLGFLVFIVIASLFVANLIRHGVPPERARPGLVILTSPLSVAGVAIVSITAIDSDPLGDGQYVVAHAASAVLLGLASCWFLGCYLPIVRVVVHPAKYTPLWWSFVFPLAAFATAWLVAGRNSGVVVVTVVGLLVWVALLGLLIWVSSVALLMQGHVTSAEATVATGLEQ